MTYLLIRQKFEDYPQWRRAYDEMADERDRHGLRTLLLTRNQADPNEIVVLFEVADQVKLRDYLHSGRLDEAWRRGGVIRESNQATFLEATDEIQVGS